MYEKQKYMSLQREKYIDTLLWDSKNKILYHIIYIFISKQKRKKKV